MNTIKQLTLLRVQNVADAMKVIKKLPIKNARQKLKVLKLGRKLVDPLEIITQKSEEISEKYKIDHKTPDENYFKGLEELQKFLEKEKIERPDVVFETRELSHPRVTPFFLYCMSPFLKETLEQQAKGFKKKVTITLAQAKEAFSALKPITKVVQKNYQKKVDWAILYASLSEAMIKLEKKEKAIIKKYKIDVNDEQSDGYQKGDEELKNYEESQTIKVPAILFTEKDLGSEIFTAEVLEGLEPFLELDDLEEVTEA